MREIRSFSLAVSILILATFTANAQSAFQKEPVIEITAKNGLFYIEAGVRTEAERDQLRGLLRENLGEKIVAEKIIAYGPELVSSGGWDIEVAADLKKIKNWKNGIYRWKPDPVKAKAAFEKYLASVEVNEYGKGTKTKLIDPSKKVTIIHLMATWLGPGRLQQPVFQELYEKYGPAGLDVVMVTVEEMDTLELLKKYVDQMKLNFRYAVPPEDFAVKTMKFTQTSAIPITFIVTDGRIRLTTVGGSPNQTAMIRQMVEETFDHKSPK